MDPEKLARIREHLLARRQLLLDAYERRREAAEEASVAEPRDEADESVRLEAQDEAWRTAEAEAKEVARIDASLTRMRERTYGECIDCGDEFEEMRLIALPTAARCMTCQESREPRSYAPSL
jgi:RNA polymerase-binding protein DksA